MRTEPERQLQAYLDQLYHALPDAGRDPVAIRPRLDIREAEDFLRGLKARLFVIDPDGYVQSPLLPPVRNSGRRQEILQIFWHWRGGRVLFREGVCQLARPRPSYWSTGGKSRTYASSLTRMTFGAAAYAVDLTVRDPSRGGVSICGEVKRDMPELRRLLDDLGLFPPRFPFPDRLPSEEPSEVRVLHKGKAGVPLGRLPGQAPGVPHRVQRRRPDAQAD